MEKFNITRIKESSRETLEDFVTEEVPFTIFIGGEETATLLCSPTNLEDLTLGFLYSSGFIGNHGDIKKLIISREKWTADVEIANNMPKEMVFKRLFIPGCGKGILFYNAIDVMYRTKISSELTVESARIRELMSEFQRKSDEYAKTGGVHSAGLADKNGIIIFSDDLGRHNAIDKVIGRALVDGTGFTDKIMLTSGRISSEIILKIRKCEIPVLVSSSAPTNQAVKLANELNITLVGFARGVRINVYSCSERIL